MKWGWLSLNEATIWQRSNDKMITVQVQVKVAVTTAVTQRKNEEETTKQIILIANHTANDDANWESSFVFVIQSETRNDS